MSRPCEELRPLLFRADEKEATPDQAMRVARHLSDCTACRIALARERRLAEMLESQLDELPVGEEFVDTVMATLPQEPPVGRGHRRRWRGLKLAGFGGLVGWLTFQANPGAGGGLAMPTRLLPAYSADGGLPVPEAAAGLARFAAAAAEALAAGLPLSVPSIAALGLAFACAAAVAGLVTVAGASAVFVAAARSLR